MFVFVYCLCHHRLQLLYIHISLCAIIKTARNIDFFHTQYFNLLEYKPYAAEVHYTLLDNFLLYSFCCCCCCLLCLYICEISNRMWWLLTLNKSKKKKRFYLCSINRIVCCFVDFPALIVVNSCYGASKSNVDDVRGFETISRLIKRKYWFNSVSLVIMEALNLPLGVSFYVT